MRQQLRCHQDYKSNGPWHDWVIVDYDKDKQLAWKQDDDDDNFGVPFYKYYCVSAKLMLFFRRENSQNALDDTYHAIVHPCSFRSKDLWRAASVLTEKWELDYQETTSLCSRPRYGIIDVVQNVVDRCMVVPERPERNAELDLVEMDKAIPGFSETYKNVILIKDQNKWGKDFIWNPHDGQNA